ncbi:MAG: hypothetical protein GTN76_04695 [Candidatus Aenigmarchaeota archaeon]|nr:hypothetical protein [Candidatus Aenigmarchaeota archaeon]
MKKLFYYMLVITVIAAISLVSVEVYAGWELYDNFNSGAIDPTRWAIDDSSATITPIFGAVRFEHQPGFPEDSSWLRFNQSPETIKAVLVTAMVQSCTGDVRGRIAGYIGKLGDKYLWNEIGARGGEERIATYVSVVDDPRLLYWGHFGDPVDLIGDIFTMGTTFFNPQNVIYYVGDLGMHTIEIFETLSPTDDHFKGIGTRSTNGDGPCVVYFDNVYVLR